MTKSTVGLRLEADELDALRKAAASREWSTSFIARKAIVDWLTRNGFLPKESGDGEG